MNAILFDMGWDTAFKKAFTSLWPLVTKFLFPMIMIILAMLLVMDIVKAVASYRRGDDVQIVPIVLLVAGIAMMSVLWANDGKILKQLVGLSSY